MLKIVLLVIFSIFSYAENIIWNTVEFPPSLITKGPLKDKGFSDQARLFISKNSKKFSHELQYTNSARAIDNLKTKENYCFSGLNKNTQREEFIEFSKPFMYSLPNEVIIKKQNLSQFLQFMDEQGRIDLEQLLKNQEFKLTYTKERSYSTFIDTLILKYEKNKNLSYRPASDLTKGFLRMLKTNRVDYIIEYPVMVGFNSKDEFLSIPIKNSDASFPVYIGCSKTPTGKKVINEINAIIEKNKTQLEQFYASYLNLETKKRYLNSVQKQ